MKRLLAGSLLCLLLTGCAAPAADTSDPADAGTEAAASAALPETEDDFCGGQLTAALRVETVEGRTFAVLGRELLEITELTEGRTPPQGLAAGSIVGFDVDPDDPYGVPIRFRGSAWLEGEDYPPTAWYAADLSARVQYENGIFTLSGLHLDGIE